MASRCEYCGGATIDGGVKCANCGAPITVDSSVPDFRVCPFCTRRLLALGSPACNYCGRRLPDEYIKARESDFKRVIEANGSETSDAARKLDELILLGSKGSRRRGSDSLDLFDITGLSDLFS